jgi:hypothetical protein
MAEDHASGDLHRTHVKEVLGLEIGYTPMFEHSLKIIPENQLSPVDWTEPLGRGANGKVFGSIWTRPRGVLASSEHGQVPVVLKEVNPTARQTKSSRTKFMREVRKSQGSMRTVEGPVTNAYISYLVGRELCFVGRTGAFMCQILWTGYSPEPGRRRLETFTRF